MFTSIIKSVILASVGFNVGGVARALGFVALSALLTSVVRDINR